MLVYYSGSVVKALLALFPEIGLDETKFYRVTRMPNIIFLMLLTSER